MKTNFIFSTNYYDALKRIISEINKRKVDLRIRHLLIVPERYTLLAEQMLYENTQGSFDVEVLSLSRLFFRMNIGTPLLSREGAIMLIRGMLPSLDLKCYYRSASYRGFCEKLYDAINDFAANRIAPEDIPASTLKLTDLKLIYSEYLRRISGRYVDSMGKLKLIAKNAENSEYLKNVHIYVVNFDYVDSATREVLDALKEKSLSYTESLIKGEPTLSSRAELFCGEGALAVKEVAKRLRFLAYNGVKYEDMAVITGNAENTRISRIFGEFDIPCFIAGSKNLYDFPLPTFLVKLFDCVKKPSRENFIELSKNIFTSVPKNDADVFENYVNTNMVDYSGFKQTFDDGTAESVRARLCEIVEAVESRTDSIRTATQFKELLCDIFELTNARRIIEEVFKSDAQTDKLLSLVSLMEQVDIKGDFDFICAVFIEGLKASKTSSLPYSGGVIVGDPAAFRGGKYAFMAVIGFDDGFLPQVYDDSSLIGDDEKALFTQMERAEQINLRYERELLLDLCSADRIFVTFTKPSGMLSELFGGVNKPSGMLSGNEPNLEEDPVFMSGCGKHAKELLINLKRRSELSGEDHTKLLNTLYAATDHSDKLFDSPRQSKIESAEKLFFPYGTTSVSQLQTYFRCPLRHFADYGLRLKERNKGKVTPIDIGSFLHLIVENVIKLGKFDNIGAAVDEVTSDIIREGGVFALEANKELLLSLKDEARHALEIYIGHLGKGKFKPIGEEIKFETPIGNIKLSGKIDFADEYNGYIRLIDYKTGGYELKFSDVYYGKKIQLPLYMAAASAKYKKGAMFNFPLSYNWLDGEFDHRFSGFLLADEEIVRAVDDFEGESEVFNLKNGQKKNDCLLSGEEMEAVVDYSVKLSENAVSEIKSGFVAPTPFDSECSYCDYACLCTERRVRKAVSVNKSVFKED